MSLDMMSAVWKQSPYSDARLLVHLALADWSNDDGASCYPTHEQIAAKVRCSTRSVQRHLDAMVEDGVIEVIEGSRRVVKGQARASYLVRAVAPTPDNLSSPTPDTGGSDTGQSTRNDGSGIPPSTRARVTINNPQAAASLAESFEAFWKAYPKCFRKSGKAGCLKIWPRVVREAEQLHGANPQQIVLATMAFALDPNRKEEYTPGPAVWLNQGKFDAYLGDAAPVHHREPEEPRPGPAVPTNVYVAQGRDADVDAQGREWARQRRERREAEEAARRNR